ncbi:DUF6204 family protein [Kitasatospora sp. NPDC048540]|uniref:DUF6204 family protein n=1 Tax=unclassified Kitasatospora TaxID=2633591 RepID=UPI000539D60F|nr:DUF6204 family protein [Kitasatospora sp. MBT63]
MSERTYRVIVRGVFAGLDEARRAELTAAADRHDILSAAFTDEGTLVYDLGLRNFSFRCVVGQAAADADGTALGAEAAERTACDRAAARLAGLGIGHGPLRAAATSVDDMKIRRPRR